MPSRPVYYLDCASGLEVPADGPRPMTRDEALHVFDSFRESASFIGVELDDKRMVQLLWGLPADGKATVDVPEPQKKGSLMRVVTIGQGRKILSQLFDDGAKPEWVAGLRFEQW